MDRARTELIERAETLARFPEFKVLTHRVPFLTKRQNELLLARLARNAMRLSTGCIVWDANCTIDGYGRAMFWMPSIGEHRCEYIHRVAWIMANGKGIPFYKEIAHDCDVPPCFNPAHLKLQRIPENRAKAALNTVRKRERRRLRERLAMREAA